MNDLKDLHQHLIVLMNEVHQMDHRYGYLLHVDNNYLIS